LTATVSSQAGVPNGGSVTFFDSTTALGTVPVSNGTAELATATLSAGLHVVTASYSGDGTNFDPSSTVVGPSSIIQTVVGTGLRGYNSEGVAATSAQLNRPVSVALDVSGNLFIADALNNVVFEVNATTHIITALAGDGIASDSIDSTPANTLQLNDPTAVAADTHGNIFIADSGSNRIREVNVSTDSISTVAGTGGFGGYNGDGIAATSAQLNNPTAVAVDAAGNIFIVDSGNARIREVNAATGLISTIAGTGSAGYNGDGIAATSAQLNNPSSIAVDAQGNLFIADTGNARVREISATTGLINTIAGTGTAGYSGDGIAGRSAQLNSPSQISLDAGGDVFIADSGNARIRELNAATGLISTVAGTGIAGYNGDGIAGTATELNGASGVFVDASGNIFIADSANARIREVSAATGLTSTVAGTGLGGHNGDGIPATSSEANTPTGVAFDAAGDLFIADANNNSIREVNATTHIITTVAGTVGFGGYNGDGIPATAAELNGPNAVAVDAQGNLFIADTGNNRIREVNARTGLISTVAGTGAGSGNSLSGPATSVAVNQPSDVAVDANGNIFIPLREVIEKVDVNTGFMSPVAGNNNSGYNGDGIPATSAELAGANGIAVDAAGNLFIADSGNARIREVDAVTGLISTVAGTGTPGYYGDGISATSAELSNGLGVALDAVGDIFIADYFNNRVREVNAGTGLISTIAGRDFAGYNGENISAGSAALNGPESVALDPAGNLLIADTNNTRVREVASGALLLAVTPATPTVVASDAGGLYNGNPFPATATETGVDGVTPVSGSISFAYYVGSTVNNNGPSTPPIDPGTYTVVATFTSSDPNYANAQSAPVTFTIDPGDLLVPTVTASDASGAYNGQPFAATATVTGQGGATVSGTFTFTYYPGSTVSGAGSSTAPTDAGTYSVVAQFTSADPNYTDAESTPVTFTIGQVAPVVTTTDASAPYTGSPFAATATAIGVDGVTPVSGSFAFTYYVGSTASGTGTSTAPTNIGTYTVVASFTSSDPNYINAQADPVTFTISPLTPNIVVSDAGGTFNGAPFPASVSVTNSSNQPISLSLSVNYSTFLGGSGTDVATNVTTDSSGDTYVTGITLSTDFPTTPGAYQTTYAGGGPATFVAKFDPTGNLLWSTLINGSSGFAIAVDAFDNVYVAGAAGPGNFTTTPGAFQTAANSQQNGFVAKLSSDGSALIWATYLGGTGRDEVTAITVDGANNVYVAGFTSSTDFPTHNALQSFNPFGDAGFATELNSSGSALVFSTYGGASSTIPSAIKVDAAGNIYVNGSTDFSSFPTTPGAFQTRFSGQNDAFVLKLGPSGTSLIYSTLLGDSGYTGSSDFGMAVDAAGDVFVTGFTDSPDFPMVNAFQSTFTGSQDAYVAELNPSGSALVGSTYFGGSSTAGGSSIALDSQGNVYIAGLTDSPDLPLVNPLSASGDYYIAEFNLSSGTLINSTYLGSTNDQGFVTPIVVDDVGNVVVAGETVSSSFPTTANAFQPNYGGGPYDAFVYGLTTGLTFTYYSGTSAGGTPLAGPPSESGTYTVVAMFTSNSPNLASAQSAPVTFTISPSGPLTPTVVAIDGSGAYDGQPFAATATATSPGGSVSGSFAFTYYVGTSATGTGSSVAPVDAGIYTVVADFTSSDPNFTDAESAPATFTITPAATTTAVGASAATVTYGQSETLTATVSSTGVTANVGTVSFFDGTTAIGTAPVSGGTATLTTTALSAGSHVISATFSGDGLDFTGSTSALSPSSIIQTVAGTGVEGYSGDGGPATSAELFFPSAVIEDAAGDLFIADSQNNVVREVNATTHVITTVAGTGTAGYSGDGSAATSAELNFPTDLALDAAGNLFIADVRNNVIREVNAATSLISTVAGTGTAGYNGDGIAATSAELNGPTSVAVDAAGDLYIADYSNNLVRKVTVATGLISSIAGTGTAGYNADGIPASSAELNQPDDVVFDAAGNLVIAEDAGDRVREVNATTGLISTIAGNGSFGYNGDGIAATSAQLNEPEGVAVDAAGNVFIADARNNRIREVNAATGLISTLAGTGDNSDNGDGRRAGSAQLGEPSDLILDAAGDVFVADIDGRVRKIVTNNAVVTVAAATPTVTALDAGGTYDGNPFPASATAIGVDGVTPVSGSFAFTYYVGSTVSGTGSSMAPTNAGTYTVVASFTSSDSNYTNAQDAPVTFTVGQAAPSVVASDAGGTYNANPFPATATATGVGGASVSGSFAFTYYVGSSVSGNGSSTAPTNAGTYTVVAAFSSSNANYTNSQSAPVTFTVGQATPTVVASDAGGTYNGNPFPATATATGVGGASVSGSFAFTYYVGSSVSGNGSSTAPTNAGTYTVVAAFTSSDSNYTNAQSAPVTFTVGQATPTVVASDAGGTYNGNPFPATATATGVGGAAVSGTFAFTYYVGSSVSGNGSSTAPTNAGTYTVVAAFTSSDSNYTNAQSAPVTFTIAQAHTTTTVVSSANPSVTSQSITFTATVGLATGGGSPTGTVTFTDGTTTLGSVAVSDFTATFTTSTLVLENHSIKATYDGDGNFVGSGSPTLTQVVQTAGFEPDPLAGGHTALFVGGTTGNDTITVVPGASGTVQVTVTETSPTSFSYNSTFNITTADRIFVFGGTGDDTIKIGALTLPVVLNGGDGNDTFQFTGAPVAGSTIDGGTGTNTIVAPNATNAWTISALNAGTVDGAAFVNVQNLTGNSGVDSFTFGSAGNLSGLITGGGGSDQIVGANIANNWQITGANAGNLNGTQFTGIKNLTGGTAIDTFVFGPSGAVDGVINGGSTGGDWLDFSAYTTPLSVNLATGTANHTGGITNIQNVRGSNGNNTLTGSAQGNILVGGIGNDTITGGSGRSLLIGGKGKDTIKGGSGDDILIGGYTDFDNNNAALMAVFAEWQRTDETYSQRISNIRGTTTGGLNGSFDLNSTTVHDDGVMDTLTGNAGLDWFFAGAGDKITDLQSGEQVN
jgi:hypothetical protein